MLPLFFAYFPIVLLIYLMSKKNSMASNRALPLCAAVVYIVAVTVYQHDIVALHATVLNGLLMALTPICIIAGAIFLFRAMEVSGALDIIRLWLNTISTHPVAQLMIIGWAFAFLIEGASGFGTPAAIAAPILYSLGFNAVRVAIFCLVLNTIPVTFGAVGTPIWFGLSVLNLSDAALADIAWQAALINTFAAPFIVIAALYFMLGNLTQIKQSFGFVLLSVFSCVLPYLLLSLVSTEFPSLIGGLIGLFLTLTLAKFNIGLPHTNAPQTDATSATSFTIATLLKATFPLWGTVVVLIVTRIHQLGIKSLLQLAEPSWTVELGQFGVLKISAALVVSLNNLLMTDQSWTHSVLYVPSFIPFVVIAVITLLWFKQGAIKQVALHTCEKMAKPCLALMGALVFVNVMMLGDASSPVALIGDNLAQLTGSRWDMFAPLLGALGTFFSGSATISNLTFGGIQLAIAEQLNISPTTVLALQSVGAAMGNMVCINNIVAVTSILGLSKADGDILKRTAMVLLLYAGIAGIAGLWLTTKMN